MSGQQDERVRVRFLTHYVQFRVTDEPFAVPISFARYALSEVVNHLLDLPTPQPFDFLVTVNGQQRLLRSTLKKFVQTHALSKEEVIEIEYMPAVTLSEDADETETDAWIGSVDAHTVPDAIVTGGYDGAIRVFDHNLKETSMLSVHDISIRCLAVTQDGDNAFIYTGSKDHGIVCTQFVHGSCHQHATLNAHQSSVESLCVGIEQGVSSKLYSGDWEGGVCIWDLNTIQGAAQRDMPRSKRQRAARESVQPADRIAAEPVALFKAHTQATSGIACNDEHTTLYTASFDHSVKVWDIEHQNTIMTFNGSKVVTSLSYNSPLNLIATSHPDGKVRIWDPRAGNENASVVKTSLSHNGAQWVSSVKWTTNNAAPLLASTDYNGVVRLWDMRGSVALAAQEAHQGKALCVDWTADNKIVSGGSDCVLRIASLTGSNEQA